MATKQPKMVTLSLVAKCPVCFNEVRAGEQHECTRGDGAKAKFYFAEMSITIPQRDMVGKPKKGAKRR